MGTRFPFTSYPRGWYVISKSEDISRGEVNTLHYFGRDLVLFRGESGKASVFHKTCPHLGAHLGGGKVEGDCLRCPFHAWAFDGDGVCIDVPYAPKIPPKARAKTWPMREHNGLIFVWFCPKEEAPTWEPPVLEEEGWTPNRHIRWVVRTHPQEVAENTVDCAHLGPVHHVARTEIRELEQDGPYMRVLLNLLATGEAIGMPEEVNDVELDVVMHGLGHIESRTHVLTAGLRARQRIHPTPIDEEQVAIFAVANIRAMPSAEYTEEIDTIFWDAFVEDFARDFPIWENKDYLEHPMLAGGDGPIGEYRRWCRQFYDQPEDVAKTAAPEPVGVIPKLLRVLRRVAPGTAATAERASVKDGEPIAVAVSRKLEKASVLTRFESVDAYFESLEARFDPSAAGKLDAVFQWVLTGDDARTQHAVVRAGAIETFDGLHEKPTVSIQMSAEDYLLMINGDLNGAMAFSTGRGKLSGPVRLAMKMQKLFPLDRAV